MYTPYLLIFTMFSGAGEIIDPNPHASLASCESELVLMQETVENDWAEHGIVRMLGECRQYDPGSWSLAVGKRSVDVKEIEPVTGAAAGAP